MTAKGRIACRRKFFFFAFYLEGFMKRITIQSIATLLVLWLVACSSLRTGSGREEKDSTGGTNATQGANHPAPGAQDVKRQTTATQAAKQQSKDAKATGASSAKQHLKYANRRGKGVESSMASARQRVRRQGEYVELQIIETQDVAPVTIEVMQPTEVIRAQTAQVIERSVEPTVIVDTEETIVRPQARGVYVASPASPECATDYETWVEIRVQ
jgi:hypothetical protein